MFGFQVTMVCDCCDTIRYHFTRSLHDLSQTWADFRYSHVLCDPENEVDIVTGEIV